MHLVLIVGQIPFPSMGRMRELHSPEWLMCHGTPASGGPKHVAITLQA